MIAKPKKLSRKALYEAVWQTPPGELAQRLGIRPEALSEACRELQIPEPSHDYWSRKSAGKPVVKRRMPPLTGGAPAHLLLPSMAEPLPPRGLHPSVAKLMDQRATRAVHAKAQGWEPAAFAPGERRRLMMMSRLFHAVERHGVHASIGELNEVSFRIGNARFECRISMKLKKADEPLPEHIKRRLPYRLRHRNLVSTGKLEFEFRTKVSQFGVRRLWSETARRTFESMVPDIAATIFHVAKETLRLRVEAERADRDGADKRSLEFRRERAEQAKWNEFLRAADAHDTLRGARHLLETLERELVDLDAVIGDRTVGEWLHWLRTRLDCSGALSRQPIDVLKRLARTSDDL